MAAQHTGHRTGKRRSALRGRAKRQDRLARVAHKEGRREDAEPVFLCPRLINPNGRED